MKVNRLSLWVPLVLLCCGTEHIDFYEESLQSAPDGAGPEGPSGNLGAGGGSQGPLRRGGYAGGMLTEEGVARGDVGSLDPACTELGGVGLYAYEPSSCLAASVCAVPCNADSDCRLEDDDAPLGEPEVDAICDSFREARYCRLVCDSDAGCPSGMVCAETGVGKTCLLPDVVWAPSCSDAFCLEEGQEYSWYGDEYYCSSDGPCCGTLSCAPDGTCQDRVCLPHSWACSETSASCCDGLTCQGGYCQTP